MFDAKALLLIYDDQAQVLELHFARKNPVRANDHVDVAFGNALPYLAGFLIGFETRKGCNVYGEAGVALRESLLMLLHEQRRGHQHRDLLTVLYSLERRAHRDLSFSVTDIATNEAVHGKFLFHVRFDLINCDELVRSFNIGKSVFQFTLPGRVRAKLMPARGHACRVELDEFSGDLFNRLARPPLGPGPVRATHLVDGGRFTTGVLGDLVELIHGNKKSVALLALIRPLRRGVLNHEVLALGRGRARADGALNQFDEAPHTVLIVNDIVTRAQFERVNCVTPPGSRHFAHVFGAGSRPPSEVTLRKERELQVGHDKALATYSGSYEHHTGLRVISNFGDKARGHIRGRELLNHAPPWPGAVSGDQKAPALMG